MRALIFLFGLFVVKRLLVKVYPPYRQRMQQFDHKVTWVTTLLVIYVVANFIYIVFFR